MKSTLFSLTMIKFVALLVCIPLFSSLANGQANSSAILVKETREIDDKEKLAIVTTSNSNQILYKNCGNDFFFTVPGLGKKYHPNVEAIEARVITNKVDPTKFRITPTGRKTVISISNLHKGQTMMIGKMEYQVIDPPKPTLFARVNGKSYDTPIRISPESKMTIRLVPDLGFKTLFPQDARYNIESIDVFVKLSIGPPALINHMKTSGKDAIKPIEIDFGDELKDVKSGIMVFVRLNNVSRKNYINNLFPEKKITERERTITFFVK